MASEKVTALIEEIKELTVIELADLVSALEEEFGVSAQAPVAVAAAGPLRKAQARKKPTTSRLNWKKSELLSK